MNAGGIPYGLVLAGGRSERMGQDKALLKYGEKPQVEYLFEILSEVCSSTFVSARSDQDFGLASIVDAMEFSDIGPMAGLLSAMQVHPVTWIVIAVDYPLVTREHIHFLIDQRDPGSDASVFYNPGTGFYEPYLGIYEPSFLEVLVDGHKSQNYSLQDLLRKSKVKQVIPGDISILRSIDTPEAYDSISKNLK